MADFGFTPDPVDPHGIGFMPDAAPPAQPGATFGNTLAGEGELAGAGLANIPHAAASAVVDLYRRLTGGNVGAPMPAPVQAIEVQPGAAGRQLVQNVEGLTTPHGTTTLAQGVSNADQALGRVSPTLQDVVHQTGSVANDVLSLAPVAAGATGVARAGIEALTPEVAAGGLRTGEGQNLLKALSGESGKAALQQNARTVGNTIAANEAGHPLNTPMSYPTMADARAPAEGVYDRAAANLPTGPLSPNAAAQINRVGLPGEGRITSGSPQAVLQIQALKDQLTDPNGQFTGQQIVNELRGLRQEGYNNLGSDDVSNQTLGKAQLGMASALETHIADSLPKNGPVSLEQLQAARTQLAKNFAVQGALRGPNVDLPTLARLQRNDPERLTDGLQALADFSNSHPEFATRPPEYNAPSVARDVANISLAEPGTILRAPLVGAVARRLMVGNQAENAARAARMFPGTAPSTFAPLEPRPPEVPVGLTAETPPAGSAAQPRYGDLATVMSHGVEQPPAPGLALGEAPQPQGGLPFRGSPEAVGARPVQGGAPATQEMPFGVTGEPLERELSAPITGNRFAVAPGNPPYTGLADVMSQGVPEGIAQRTSAPPVEHSVEETTGSHTFTSPNGTSTAQESGKYLKLSRSDTAIAARGQGEGAARIEAVANEARRRGLIPGSDVSVSPAEAGAWRRFGRQSGATIVQNPSRVNPSTGNLVSDDPRVPVFEAHFRNLGAELGAP